MMPNLAEVIVPSNSLRSSTEPAKTLWLVVLQRFTDLMAPPSEYKSVFGSARSTSIWKTVPPVTANVSREPSSPWYSLSKRNGKSEVHYATVFHASSSVMTTLYARTLCKTHNMCHTSLMIKTHMCMYIHSS